MRFGVEKGAEELRPPSGDKSWVSQHLAIFAADVLRANLPCTFYVQGLLNALEEPTLIAALRSYFLRYRSHLGDDSIYRKVIRPIVRRRA